MSKLLFQQQVKLICSGELFVREGASRFAREFGGLALCSYRHPIREGNRRYLREGLSTAYQMRFHTSSGCLLKVREDGMEAVNHMQ